MGCGEVLDDGADVDQRLLRWRVVLREDHDGRLQSGDRLEHVLLLLWEKQISGGGVADDRVFADQGLFRWREDHDCGLQGGDRLSPFSSGKRGRR